MLKSGRHPLSWIRRHKIYSLLILLVLFIVGWFVYEKVATEMNRLAFTSAQQRIDKIYTEATNKISAPNDVKVVSGCSRSQEELKDGPLYCHSTKAFMYGVSDKYGAGIIEATIDEIFKKDNGLVREVNTAPMNDSSISDSSPIYAIYRDKHGLEVKTTYVYNPSFDTKLKKERVNNLYIEFSVSGIARQIYY